MYLTDWKDIEEFRAREGIFGKLLEKGTIQVILYRYLPGSVFETHSHPEEQMTIGMEGELEFEIDDEKVIFGPGSIAHIPGGAPHSAVNRGKEEAITINIYSPPRK
ncbi:MAG: cupin domain-containing protein [Thermoplasmatota archaeon]